MVTFKVEKGSWWKSNAVPPLWWGEFFCSHCFFIEMGRRRNL